MFTDTGNKMTRPLVQIDKIGSTREMTDEELETYEALMANSPDLPSAD
jgi:hypothetical protein